MTHTLSDFARRLNFEAGVSYLPSLLFLTDEKRLPDPREAVTHLPAGSAVLLRHYRSPNRKKLAQSLRSVCDKHSLSLIVADDTKLATEVGADGIHLPEYRLMSPTASILSWRHSRRGVVTGATHSPLALRAAFRMGVDAVLLSPVFASASHPKKPPLGVIRFAKLCRFSSLPVYALGGITGLSAKRLIGSGAAGVAAIGALVDGIE